jgi:hypothetical protein
MHLAPSRLDTLKLPTHAFVRRVSEPHRTSPLPPVFSPAEFPPAMITTDTDLGCIEDLIPFVGLKRTYIQAIKRCANERHTKENPSPFVGRFSCKRWLVQWLQRNRDFKVELAYPTRRQPTP